MMMFCLVVKDKNKKYEKTPNFPSRQIYKHFEKTIDTMTHPHRVSKILMNNKF